MVAQHEEYRATGRRKRSVATVKLIPGEGRFEVNGKPFESYFPREELRLMIFQPLEITGNKGKFDIVAKVRGGGIAGQAGATRHSIARALAKSGESTRHILKQAGLLTRDQRMKERKKYGQPGARKRFQFSKR